MNQFYKIQQHISVKNAQNRDIDSSIHALTDYFQAREGAAMAVASYTWIDATHI